MNFKLSDWYLEKITHKSVNFHRIALKISPAHIFDSINMCMKLQASAVSRFS